MASAIASTRSIARVTIVANAMYFSVTTLATVGLGAFAPTTDAGKVFTVMYILTGVVVLASFLSFMAERASRRSSD